MLKKINIKKNLNKSAESVTGNEKYITGLKVSCFMWINT